MDLTGAVWRKSSYSGSNGGTCIEVATVWRKSSYTSSNAGNCVEVADAARLGAAEVVAVRDSKDPEGPKLAFAPARWRAFLEQVKTGGPDLG